ncbi:hypothetical protein [Primorskyibacter flagellatus]|uniref:hypothetical protein n=1 Tax=Primorskyibacter flagellatus TaxID=1387277 RepID=UPI003A94B1AF
MTRTSIAALLMLVAGQANALSCMRPDVARDYAQAASADETYFVVTGMLSFDPSGLPVVDYDNQSATPPETDIAAHLTGKTLTSGGFTAEFDRDVILRVHCFGPWCASPQPDTRYLSFVESTEQGLVMHVDPCGGLSHPEPTPEMQARVLACTTGDCPLDDVQRP